ncbi:MAG: DoxX family protein [Planctomycetota bacterium]
MAQKKQPILILSWIARLVVAGIFLQTLFFKFTASEESVYIFTTLGVEPWGRIASGIVELAAAVLLLMPKTVWFGALLALGAMSGAILSHVTRLGIVVQDDGGLLFSLAVGSFALSLLMSILHLPHWVLAKLASGATHPVGLSGSESFDASRQ